jgi:CRP-like cAMP-binding protein
MADSRPFLYSQLTTRQRAAYPYVIRGVREGLSQRKIEAALRVMELGIRHEVMRSMIRHEQTAQEYSNVLGLLRPSEKPVASRLPQALTKLTRRYAFTVEVTGTMPRTGQRVTHYITLSMSALMSRSAMESLAQDIVAGRKERYATDVEAATLKSGLRAGPEGTI